MIDALIQGKLHKAPQQRTGKDSRPFTTCLVRTATRGDALFISCIVFDDKAQQALQMLGDGDSISLAGELTPKVFIDKDGQARPAADMVVHKVLTVYSVSRRRQAATDRPKDEAWRAMA